MRKLFGTDGIRGVAGEAPLDPRTIYAVGFAIAHQVKARNSHPRFVLGMDTRESSEWIAAVLTAGLNEGGAKVESAGVITTPAIAYLARKHGFDAGIVISASHNPWQDNGIKVFGGDGYKLSDAIELEVEQEIFQQIESRDTAAALDTAATSSCMPGDHGLREAYEKWLRTLIGDADLSHLKIIVDCANGAACSVAPELF